MKLKTATIVAFLLLPACGNDPQRAAEEVEEKDHSFESIAAERLESHDGEKGRLRLKHAAEVKRCEEELRGEWEGPGRCCIWTAMGCAEQKL